MLVSPAASFAGCGVAVLTVNQDIMTDDLLMLDLSTGRMGINLLHVDPLRTQYTVPELNQVFFFSDSSAWSVDVTTYNTTNYPGWSSPVAINGPTTQLIQFAGYDATKNVIYAYNVNEINSTRWTVYASDIAQQTWRRVFTFVVSELILSGYDLSVVLSADATALSVVVQSGNLRKPVVSTFNLTTGTWSAANETFTLKYPFYATPLYSRGNNDIVVWMQQGQTYIGGAYSITTGDQTYVSRSVAYTHTHTHVARTLPAPTHLRRESYTPALFVPTEGAQSQALISVPAAKQILFPGCQASTYVTRNMTVSLLDLNSGSVAYAYSLKLGASQTMFNAGCEWTYIPVGCSWWK